MIENTRSRIAKLVDCPAAWVELPPVRGPYIQIIVTPPGGREFGVQITHPATLLQSAFTSVLERECSQLHIRMREAGVKFTGRVIFRRAVRLIHMRGWSPKAHALQNGPYSALGALRAAAGFFKAKTLVKKENARWAASRAAWLFERWRPRGPWVGYTLSWLNDRACRTEDEVIALLEQFT